MDGLAVFLVVAELRGFRAAARQLGITPSAVSQSIRALETAVGVPLLVRTTRNVGLTEAGERLLSQAKPAMDMLTSGIEAAMGLGDEVSGLLRLNVPRTLLPLLANRLLPEFCSTYPAVQLELFAEDRMIDVVEEGFDAGICFGETIQADMVAVRLTPPLQSIVVGAPAYFQQHGYPTTPQELQQHRCIQLRTPSQAIFDWEFIVDGQPVDIAVKGPLIVNDADLNLRAALMGVGLAYLPRPLAMFHIANGRLETTLDCFAAEKSGLTLYYPNRTQSLPKLRAFIDFARARLRQDFQPSDYQMPAIEVCWSNTAELYPETDR
nr:LysR family transcriptional regulator [Azomonas macrocytogenes]